MNETGYLDLLQEPMEAIGLGHDANAGRFCGHCYARLGDDLTPRPPSLERKGERRGARAGTEGHSDEEEQQCEVCGASTEDVKPVASVPAEALALYLAKRQREGLLVNSFALFGIFLSMVVSAVLWLLLPSGWLDILPFAMLVVGSYCLARVFGLWIGATLGYNSGRSIRDRRWNQFLAQRAAPTGEVAGLAKRRDSGSAGHD